MDTIKTQRLRHYLRLSYPVRVVAHAAHCAASCPDLPGCEVSHEELPRLYAALEMRRIAWITEQVLAEAPIPAPNAALAPAPVGPDAAAADAGLRPEAAAIDAEDTPVQGPEVAAAMARRAAPTRGRG